MGLDDPQVPLPDGVERRHQLQAAELLGAAPRAVLADQLPAGPLEQVAVVVDPQPVLVVEPVVDQSPPAGPEGEEVELGDGGVDRGVVVLERAGPVRGLTRSWALTRGGQAWRVLGIILLAALLTGIFSSAVTLPISAVVQALVGLTTDDLSAQLTGTVIIEHVVQLVVNAVVTPFSAGVTALLYLDQRVRREGLDMTMIRAAQERAAARRA